MYIPSGGMAVTGARKAAGKSGKMSGSIPVPARIAAARTAVPAIASARFH